jgi:glycosyltransferase involved in cell wall biosynthesis
MKRILLLIKVPPPVTGATSVNSLVHKSEILQKYYTIKTVKITYVDEIRELGKFKISKTLKFFKIYYFFLYNLYKFKPQLVYFQISPVGIPFLRDSIFVITMKFFKVRILFHLHGKGIMEKMTSKLARTYYKYIFNNVHVICLSKLLTNDINHVYNGEPYIVNNGIIKRSSYYRFHFTNTTPSILFLSNLHYSKGILDFLEAIEILKCKNLDFKAIIAGNEADIDEKNLLNILIQKKITKYAKYIGAKNGKEKQDVFLDSSIFVHPTLKDSFPLVLLEAMQFGLPIISTYEGAIPEIVDDGITGFLIDKHNPQALADKIETLFKDKELREKMGRAGRKKFLEKYTLDIFEKNLKNVFDQVLDEI